MARTLLNRLITSIALYAYGVFSLFLYLALFIKNGEYFRKFSEQDKLQYAISE